MLFNLDGLFDFTAILVKEQFCYYLTCSWRVDKEVHTFFMSINPNVNVIALIEFEFAY